MAGSRVHTVGTIFTRVQSLLRTGAMKEVEKPLWYDVYAAFPPHEEPVFERPLVETEPIEILYHEDVVRAKFYRTYGNPDVIDMRDGVNPSVSQRFIEKYNEQQQQEDVDAESLFNKTEALLNEDGFYLKSLEQIKQEHEEENKATQKKLQQSTQAQMPRVSVGNIFGSDIPGDFIDFADEQDFLHEDTLNPKNSS